MLSANTTTGTAFRLAGAWKNGAQTVVMNGTTVTTGTNPSPNIQSTQFAVGAYAGGSALNPWNGWLREVKYWNRALSQQELISVT